MIWQAIGELHDAWFFALGFGDRTLIVERHGSGLIVQLTWRTKVQDLVFQTQAVITELELALSGNNAKAIGLEFAKAMRHEFATAEVPK